jgi:TrmH family RNA methyltransferase
MTLIESTRNPRLRAALALRDRGERDATGLTLVDGVRELGRALDAGVEVVESFVDDSRSAAPDLAPHIARLRDAGAQILPTVPAALRRLAFGDRDEGIVTVIRQPATALAALPLRPDPLVVVVERVEKPGNLGAILRSADGAGVDAVIAADPRTDLFNPNAIRASLGTIFALKLASAPTDEVLVFLERQAVRPVAALVDGGTVYTEADLTGPVALVLGSESAGLSPAWRAGSAGSIEGVRLPMYGVADSLNVSTAAAILLYEARRQRGEPPGRTRPRTLRA